MLTRRRLIAASAAASLLAAPALAQQAVRLPRAWMPADVEVATPLPAGTVYVDVADTWLYLGLPSGMARRYKVAVGAVGRTFRGQAHVGRKAEWPAWRPTADMIRAEPAVYGPFAAGLPGGRDTMFRIHGTPQPWTMGQSFSSGCIRLVNDHAVDLYDRVEVGAPVVSA